MHLPTSPYICICSYLRERHGRERKKSRYCELSWKITGFWSKSRENMMEKTQRKLCVKRNRSQTRTYLLLVISANTAGPSEENLGYFKQNNV